MTIPACYLFNGLSDSQRQLFHDMMSLKSVAQGTWLFHREEPAEELFFVQSGAVELLIETDEGVEIPVSMIRPGNGCVGVGALVPPFEYTLSARCARDSELMVMRRADLEGLLQRDPHLGRVLMANLAGKLMERLNETRREVQLRFLNMVRSASL
jgi:CRP-like cAMP-binding protein